MFRAKSDVTGKKLAQRIEADFAWFTFGTQKVGIAQLEITDVKPLVETRRTEIIAILKELAAKEGLDTVFISLIDLGEGFNAFIADDAKMQTVLSDVLGVSFNDNLSFRPDYIMRKEIVPLLKEKLG